MRGDVIAALVLLVVVVVPVGITAWRGKLASDQGSEGE